MLRQHSIRLNPDEEPAIWMTFNEIPAAPEGTLIGSRGYEATEEPIHRVVIPEAFWMAETPVTQAQFAVWTQRENIEHANHFPSRPEHPAESISWLQATEYCKWLTKRFSSQFPHAGLSAELPLEAHWEYACRAGTSTEYFAGDGKAALNQVGWYGEERESDSTHPVKQKLPNRFGLYDLHGNVWEWCRDRWDAAAYRRRWNDITAEETLALSEKHGDANTSRGEYGEYRVLRGGSWSNSAVGCRSAYRFGDWAGFRIRYVGFRVCLVRSPTASG